MEKPKPLGEPRPTVKPVIASRASKNIFPEQDKLDRETKTALVALVAIDGCGIIFGIALFLFLVWATVTLLRYMGVL